MTSEAHESMVSSGQFKYPSFEITRSTSAFTEAEREKTASEQEESFEQRFNSLDPSDLDGTEEPEQKSNRRQRRASAWEAAGGGTAVLAMALAPKLDSPLANRREPPGPQDTSIDKKAGQESEGDRLVGAPNAGLDLLLARPEICVTITRREEAALLVQRMMRGYLARKSWAPVLKQMAGVRQEFERKGGRGKPFLLYIPKAKAMFGTVTNVRAKHMLIPIGCADKIKYF